jgi:lipopolysaccharide transport system permease protein
MLQRLWTLRNYRELILNFVLRDVKEKYRGTILGYFWTLVTPLLLMGIFFFIFTYIFPVKVPHYPLYVMIGLLSWTFFSSALYDATLSIRGGAELLKKVYFPAEIYPISAVSTNLITFCFSLLVLLPFLFSYKVGLDVRLLWLPAIVLWQAGLCLGLGMILAIAHVYFRDTGPLVGTGLNLWFYATPIFYTTSIMPQEVTLFYFLNPAAVIVELYRWAIMGNPAPMGVHLVCCGILTLGFLLTGLLLYARWGKHVAKVI